MSGQFDVVLLSGRDGPRVPFFRRTLEQNPVHDVELEGAIATNGIEVLMIVAPPGFLSPNAQPSQQELF